MEITREQYFKIKALFNAASKDGIRPGLQNVFYNHGENHFVATDGHMLRILKLEDFPKKGFSFQLTKAQFMLTEIQYKAVHGFGTIKVRIDSSLQKENKYVEYLKTIPEDDSEKVDKIGLSPEIFMQFSKTFYKEKVKPRLEFTKGGPIKIFSALEDNTFLGVIMPFKLAA